MKADELNALADECAQQHADYVVFPDWDLPDSGVILLHAAAALREQAEAARERDRLAAWQDAVLDAVQADLEHGVRPLNEAAAKDFQKRFPNLCAALGLAPGAGEWADA